MRNRLITIALVLGLGLASGLAMVGCDGGSMGALDGAGRGQSEVDHATTAAGLAALPDSEAGPGSESGDASSSAEDARAEAGEEEPESTGDARSSETASKAAGDSSKPSSPATYYQWVDERGSVHFASSLDEVPYAWRERAGRIELAEAAFSRTGTASAKPAARRAAPEPIARSHDVTVYTAPWCGWCRKTVAFLDSQGVDYVNKDIEADPDYEAELRAKIGRVSIPLVEIDDRQIRGFDPAAMMAMLIE